MSTPGEPGGQVENLRDNLLPPPAEEKRDEAGELKPRMCFRTSYVLTREQEDALCEVAKLRIGQLEEQMGRKVREGVSKGQMMQAVIADENSFLGKRERFTLRYFNHVEDRAKENTVYHESNLTASLSQRITMQMVATAINFFFGQPDDIDWFSSNAVGAEDEEISDKVKKHSRWKADQCGVKHKFIEGIEFAFVRGEAVLKVTHQSRGQIYKRTATILMDETGEPILDANEDYIVEGDTFMDEMGPPPAPGIIQRIKAMFTGPEPGAVTTGTGSEVGGEMAEAPDYAEGSGEIRPAAEAAGGEPQLVATGEKILKRDGVTVLPKAPIWKEQVITRRLVTFEGPEAALVYYQDFLYPLEAIDLQSADFVTQLYDKNVMQIAEMFRGQYGEGDANIADMAAAVTSLREMLNESDVPKTAASQPRADFKETDTTGAAGVPVVEVAECYLTYDADGDGIQEEIMLVMDRRNEAPIYYEYLANITVRGVRPFYMWRPMPVDGRCYGMGAMELFDPEQEFIDLQINRHNFRTSEAGIVKFWKPGATEEGSRDRNLKLNNGQTYTLRDGNKGEDALSYIELPTDAKSLEYQINLFMQLMQMKSGVLNGADRAVSGLPSSDTLGEEEIITSSGEELFKRMLAHLFPGVKAALGAVIDVTYANMNRVEIFNFFNGEANEILSLDPADVRDLALNVTLELSRTQQRKAQEYGDRTTALITWFYGLPFILQQRAGSYARQQLKGFGVSQADKIIDPVDLSPGNVPPEDKPSAVGTMIASLIKAGAPITVEVVSAVMQKAGLPPVAGAGVVEPPEAKPKEEPPPKGPAV